MSRTIPLKAEPSRADIIDEFGELDRKVQEFAPTAKRHEALKSQIKTWFENHPADQELTEEGKLYTLQVGARAKERRIASLAKVFKALGANKFLGICSVGLKALEDALGKDKAAGYIVEDQSGSRRLKVVAKAAQSLPKAA